MFLDIVLSFVTKYAKSEIHIRVYTLYIYREQIREKKQNGNS